MALARALVNQPSVLLLDEPLGALDLKLREQMQVELKAIQRQVGITFIYVTHDQGEALTMSDRIAVFNKGRIEQIGSPAEIYEHPASAFVAGFVGVSNISSPAPPPRPSPGAPAGLLDPAGEDPPGRPRQRPRRPMPAPSTGRSPACSISAPAPASTWRSPGGGELTVIEQNREETALQRARPARASPCA